MPNLQGDAEMQGNESEIRKQKKNNLKWRNKNTALYILLIPYFLSYILDHWSTVINGDLVQYLEANALYRVGGWWLVYGFSASITYLLVLYYVRTSKPFNRFWVTNFFVLMTLAKCVAAYNNYQVYLHPPSMEVAMSVSQEALTSHMSVFAVVLVFLPYLVSVVTYLFWKNDHHIMIRGKAR
jgi:uncharacterized membrane protein YidH (DUF202 family)